MCSSECLVDKGLPFLLVVLEWALSTAVNHLSDKALSFERQVLPLLEGLAMKVFHCVSRQSCNFQDIETVQLAPVILVQDLI